MEESLVIAGFGGQGVMLIGKMLGHAASDAGKQATFYPSYGAEMRGGTANCTVVISDKDIGSPLSENPKTLIAMNEPSYHRFAPAVKAGGKILVNSSLFKQEVKSGQADIYSVPVNDIAAEIGNPRVANIVMLGAYIGATNALNPKVVEEYIKKSFAEKPNAVEANIKALNAGIQAVRSK